MFESDILVVRVNDHRRIARNKILEILIKNRKHADSSLSWLDEVASGTSQFSEMANTTARCIRDEKFAVDYLNK